MNDIHDGALLLALIFLLLLSAFFSGSETGMMVINRYRLKHLVSKKHSGAIRTSRLLERPDRLIGVILLGNNFVNILASSLATVLAMRWLGEAGIAVASITLTFILLIFSEVTPKTLGVLYPERIAFPASYILGPLLKLLYPLVWLVNFLGNSLLGLFGIKLNKSRASSLNAEELRTVVHEAEGIIPKRHQQMLLGILDLEKVTVDDIMIPRNEILGIDLNASESSITEQLINARHTRVPVYYDSIDNVVGIVHLRKILRFFENDEFSKEALLKSARDLYFVPEGTPLHTQLINFQRHKRRIGLVVNEYGDIQGLVTLEDILEEIVGEFTTGSDMYSPNIHSQDDGSFLVDAGITVRELNKAMQWHLPTDGPKTLNGLILDYLETIPEADTSLRLGIYPMDIVQMANNSIKMVRIYPVGSS